MCRFSYLLLTLLQRGWNIPHPSVLSTDRVISRGVLKSSSRISGEPSVTTTGAPTTPGWSAGSWVYLLLEHGPFAMLGSVKVLDQSFLTMCSAMETRPTSQTAPVVDCLITTATTMKMLVSHVKVGCSGYKVL